MIQFPANISCCIGQIAQQSLEYQRWLRYIGAVVQLKNNTIVQLINLITDRGPPSHYFLLCFYYCCYYSFPSIFIIFCIDHFFSRYALQILQSSVKCKYPWISTTYRDRGCSHSRSTKILGHKYLSGSPLHPRLYYWLYLGRLITYPLLPTLLDAFRLF